MSPLGATDMFGNWWSSPAVFETLHGTGFRLQLLPPSADTPRNASLLLEPDEADGATNDWYT